MKKMLVRFLIYGVVLGYLWFDLKVMGGPVWRAVEKAQAEQKEASEAEVVQGLVARVFAEPILISQVDRRVRERLYLDGINAQGLRPDELKLYRTLAVNELVDDALLRRKVDANTEVAPVTNAEIEEDFERFVISIGGEGNLESFLEYQGFDGVSELRYRLAARRQQVRYLDRQIAPSLEISDEAVQASFDDNEAEFVLPARSEVRQIFIETLDRGDRAGQVRAEVLFKQLKDGADFANLAASESDDPRSKLVGGRLGWLADDGRMGADFIKSVMKMRKGGRQIVKTRLGYHIVEILETEPERPLRLDEVYDEIELALQNEARIEALKVYKARLRQQHEQHWVIDYEALDAS